MLATISVPSIIWYESKDIGKPRQIWT